MNHHLIAFAGLIAFAILIGIYIERWWKGFKFKSRVGRGRTLEKDAHEFLERQGFTVLDRQIPTFIEYLVDGIMQKSEVRADYLVSKDGKTFIAEVKSGNTAPDISHSPTRRQLLEYALAFHNPNLLLVDMEAEEIREIQFPDIVMPQRRFNPWLIRFVFASLLVGVFLGAYLGHHLPVYWKNIQMAAGKKLKGL